MNLDTTAFKLDRAPGWLCPPAAVSQEAAGDAELCRLVREARSAAETLCGPLLSATSKDDLLDALDEAAESQELVRTLESSARVLHALPTLPLPCVSSDELNVRERVFGQFASRLAVADGFRVAAAKAMVELPKAPPSAVGKLGHLPAPMFRLSMQALFGEIATYAVFEALHRGQPLPDWMADVLSDRVVAGVKAFLTMAAVRIPTLVDEKLIPATERLDIDEMCRATERYLKWRAS